MMDYRFQNPYQMYGTYGQMQQAMMQPQQIQQPQQQMQQMPQQNQQPNIICRPVASEEEARAVPTDFSGATLVLTDTAHGKIYTKALNYMDGSAIFNTYQVVQQVPAQQAPVQTVEYAPMSELESLRAELEEIKKSMAPAAKKTAAKGAVAE